MLGLEVHLEIIVACMIKGNRNEDVTGECIKD